MIKEIRKGLLRWYCFKKGGKALYIGNAEDALAEYLEEYGLKVRCADVQDTLSEDWTNWNERKYDYLVSVEDLEKCEYPAQTLALWIKLLKPDGHMILGMNNRLGLRYFCGDRDLYTGRSFDGIEDYQRAYAKKEDTFGGHMYDRDTLKRLLQEAGWNKIRFFSVFSDLKNPSLIYVEDYLPNEDLANRVFPVYNHPDTVFLEEESLYDGLIRNGMFHQTANAYLIECTKEGDLSDVAHVTGSMERGRKDALLTVVHKAGMVEKRAVYLEGKKRLEELEEHGHHLKARGIKVVEGRISDGSYQMPYIDAEVGQVYLRKLLFRDKEKFLETMDHFRDLILQSSEIEKPDQGDGMGAVLRKGYLDLIPLNSFFMDGEFIFYDQEFCEEHYPANVIILRMVSSFYRGNLQLQKILPMQELFQRYGLTKHLDHWYEMEWKFLGRLLNEKELSVYHEKCRRNPEIVHANRQRINYSEAEYQRLFVDIFKGAEARKLFLFGSGKFAKRFIDMYGNDFSIYGILDNNKDRWGKEVAGILVQSPDILRQLDSDEYKVFICIKNYLSVMKQLEDMGVRNYGIFDPMKAYPLKRGIDKERAGQEEAAPKKYHIGYVAGVFDMFHAGHLNILRRAKEQSDYLIAGIVSDEGAYRKKKKYPIIPEEDRAEIVRACKYVDEAEILSPACDGIRDAYKRFQFDCQFTGTDYENHPGWLADREYLERQGAELVFFPYTEKISSTELRKKLGGKGNKENEN